MKKMFASLLALSMVLVGCGSGGGDSEDKTPEIALVTDQGTISDKSFNQSAWEAVEEYGDKNKVSRMYLHANRLRLYYPVIKKEILFETPIPNEFKKLMKS